MFAETEHIITRNTSHRTAYTVQDWLLQQKRTMRVLVPDMTAAAPRTARGTQNRYAQLRPDLADTVNTVLAEQYETQTVLTLDRRNFRTIRP